MVNNCFHCGLPNPKGSSYQVEISNQKREMCCIGCQAVAQAIVDNQLSDFYNHRTQKSNKQKDLVPAELQIYDSKNLQQSFVKLTDGKIKEASLILEGIVCAACVWLNEKHIMQLDGVIEFRVNYSTHRASLKWDDEQVLLSEVLQAIIDIGYNAHPFDPSRVEAIHKKEKSAALRRIALAGMGMMQVMMPAIAIYIGEDSDMSESMRNFLRWISLIITTPVVFYSARIFFVSAWRDIRRGVLGMDVPVSLAIGSAYIASIWATFTNSGEVYFDSVVMFTFFLLIGRFLEMGARHKSGEVADALVRLLPDTATRINTDRNGKESLTVISANELALGDQVLIKPGEIVPADGEVISGSSSCDESLLTGESLPIVKSTGDLIVGGSVNRDSPLKMQVDKLGDSTKLSSIIRLLDRAQSEKPSLAKFADRSAGLFVLSLLVIAVLVFLIWYWFIDPSRAFWVALSVLVITCPCALSLATPAALTAVTGNLTKKGILTTRGHALETLSKVTHVIFDKTGTLTHGRLTLVNTQYLSDRYSQNEIHNLAAGLESVSEHPFAQAIMNVSTEPLDFDSISSETGRGISAYIDGVNFRIGTLSFINEILDENNNTFLSMDNNSSSNSVVYFASSNHCLALFEFKDESRAESFETIKTIKSLGIEVSLLSGDNQSVVEAIGKELDITELKAEQQPSDKLAEVQKLQSKGYVVAMLGDGVNDAPVLAAADVSIAMGSGTQLAQASADMVLLSENLSLVPEAIALSRRMQHIVYQNFSWAILYNIIAIPIASMGWITPWMAAIGMSMSSLLVVLNALRLK